MDHEVCLKEILELADDIKRLRDEPVIDHELISCKADELAERVVALDGWITNRSPLPRRWSHA